MPKHISLIGMMGSGKTTVAPLLAAALGREAVEVDGIIEKLEGMPIGEIFIAKGEAYFRRVESEVIGQLLTRPPGVLSLGGGAFQWHATRATLLAGTVVFYLSAQIDTLTARLRSVTAQRPLLNVPGFDWQQTVRDLLQKREASYAQAHYRVETDSHTPEEVARAIELLREAYD